MDFSNRELPTAIQSQAFATVERNIDTEVMVADKDTIVLGGLARDNQTETVAKVPLLGDIPILGWLFSSHKRTTEKVNLLIFMTPQIIKQYDRIRAVLDKKLKERDEFVESATGGEDANRKYRDKIIKDLPDLKEITLLKAKEFDVIDGEAAGGIANGKSGGSASGSGNDPIMDIPPPAFPGDFPPPPPMPNNGE